jgi:hypothetical protein
MAAGPRVWSYEAGLMLPILAWAVAGGMEEPRRTRFVYLAIGMGILWWLSPITVVSGVAVVVDGAALMWIWRWRPLAPNRNRVADDESPSWGSNIGLDRR